MARSDDSREGGRVVRLHKISAEKGGMLGKLASTMALAATFLCLLPRVSTQKMGPACTTPTNWDMRYPSMSCMDPVRSKTLTSASGSPVSCTVERNSNIPMPLPEFHG